LAGGFHKYSQNAILWKENSRFWENAAYSDSGGGLAYYMKKNWWSLRRRHWFNFCKVEI
jgi:hypothetical protein